MVCMCVCTHRHVTHTRPSFFSCLTTAVGNTQEISSYRQGRRLVAFAL